MIEETNLKNMFENIKKSHFIGIGGIGVSALARMMLSQKKKVSGSDILENIVNQRIKKLGAKVFISHKTSNLAKDIDIVIYSPAIKNDNSELVEAKKLKIPTYSYPEVLGLISKEKYTIAISGTHGKTTTTAMLAEVMISNKKDPTVIIGSFLRKQKDNFIFGKSKYFIVEACEYKESFLNLFPDILVITNIDNDHLDYFKNLKNIQKTFAKMISKVPESGFIVYNSKDKNTKQTFKLFKIKANLVDYTKEKKLELQVPGKHNIENAQAVLAVAKILKIEAEKSLKKYLGVWRRFEYKGKSSNNAIIYDDYAHHPSEVEAIIKATREKFPKQRIFIVFQPHLYSRTKLLLNDFAMSFNHADQVIITDIYAAREKMDKSIHAKDLVRQVNFQRSDLVSSDLAKQGHAHRGLTSDNEFCKYISDFKEVIKYLKENTSKNDIIMTMGAGDVYEIGEKLKS